ncbi:hypothetical protein DNTS_014184 [Danionella cerebrum]|uniref:EGF-like domain-containing protein n=1 Tax=Danionella cerebrum TaxID=2873325 RepID=A0A553MY74_9TELE|nr:hypothetical protein DNTS_014184 [Danionella translucida]
MEHLGALLLLVLSFPLAKGFPACSSDQLMCDNSKCVSKTVLCNAVDDCGDGSDEISCLSCTGQSFLCVASARCVSSSSICDGKLDCTDGADEFSQTCTTFNKSNTCARSEFRCTSGQCVTSSWRCDHSRDCEDGSDEEDCDLNECKLNNGGCSHVCIDLQFGFRCDCPRGMRLVQDTHCEGDDGFLILSTHEGIKWSDLSLSKQTNITDKRVAPGSVSSLNANDTLFWSNPEDDVIFRMPLNSSEHGAEVVCNASFGILGLAVDWVHERFYWVSTVTHGLHMTSLNGATPRQLISGLSRPTAVAVQPLQGADKHNGNELSVSQRYGSGPPGGLLVLHPLLQPADQERRQSDIETSLPVSPLIFLTVFLGVLFLALLLFWQRSRICAAHSLAFHGDMTLNESQDPLLLSRAPWAPEIKVRQLTEWFSTINCKGFLGGKSALPLLGFENPISCAASVWGTKPELMAGGFCTNILLDE